MQTCLRSGLRGRKQLAEKGTLQDIQLCTIMLIKEIMQYLTEFREKMFMNISKSKIESLLKELPEKVDIEEVMYRLYLLQKIEAGEKAIRKGRTLSHKEAIKRLSRKWQN